MKSGLSETAKGAVPELDGDRYWNFLYGSIQVSKPTVSATCCIDACKVLARR